MVQETTNRGGEQPKSNAQKKRDRLAAKQEKQKAKKAKDGKRDDQWAGEIDRQNLLFEKYYQVSPPTVASSILI